MRYTLPRADLRAMDRRTGAYPTKVRTGDRTRTGKNPIYFDDTRTVVFASGVMINLPTTFATSTNHLVDDLTSSFVVRGDVLADAVDQWIPHRDQSEPLGPFVEHFLYEQDENNTVNSLFMTGAAYGIASDRFKSKLSNKTIIRLEEQIASSVVLHPSASAMHYYNSRTKVFDRVVVEQRMTDFFAPSGNTFFGGPWAFDRVLFTPYGFTHSPVNFDIVVDQAGLEDFYLGGNTVQPTRETLLQKVVSYTPNGNELWDATDNWGVGPATSSLLNPVHKANTDQTIKLTNSLSHPFLLEKAVLELDIEAGEGWMNDSFAIFFAGNGDLSPYQATSIGGPAITFALLRQDKTSPFHRDLIASGAITNAFDVHTASFVWDTYSSNGFDLTTAVKSPLNDSHSVNQIIYGTSLSGSGNAFTGTVKLVMDPAVTQHVFRGRMSGSLYLNSSTPLLNGENEITYMVVSSNGCRPGEFKTTRNVLGNQLVMLSPEKLSSPIATVKEGVGIYTTNVVCATTKSPYLLYPEDELIVCINKCAHGRVPHDVKIKAGTMKLTLYGDLIKEDREFHDTLNQRLETTQVWENLGEEPVLDQFDVAYPYELSGSYLDRNNIFTQASYLKDSIVSDPDANFNSPYITTLEYQQDTGHFSANTSRTLNLTWRTIGYTGDDTNYWATGKYAYEVRKSNRNPVLLDEKELFWDTRIILPNAAMARCNPDYLLTTDTLSCLMINGAYSGNISDLHASPFVIGTSGNGILDWYMTYPYEARYNDLTYAFYDELKNDVFRRTAPGAHSTALKLEPLNYNEISLEIGSLSGSASNCSRFLASEGVADITKWGTGYSPLKKPEFIKYFFGTGTGVSEIDNKHVRPRTINNTTADLRGWRYGMLSAFPMYTMTIFRRSRYGQFRDMLEQRLDGKFYDQGVKESPVQVKFYDARGKFTDPLRTLSSNLSLEATSSVPYVDEVSRNRSAYDFSNLNITRTAISD